MRVFEQQAKHARLFVSSARYPALFRAQLNRLSEELGAGQV